MNAPASNAVDLQLDDALVRVMRLRTLHDRAQSCASGVTDVLRDLADAFVRRFLAEVLRASSDQIVLRTDLFGRPAVEPIPGRATSTRLDFSVSYGTGVLAMGASDTAKIGIDIETCQSGFDFAPVMDSFFAPAERERVRSLPAERQSLEFLRVWTAKEAYVKAIGHGLAFGLNEVETVNLGSGELALHSVRRSEDLAAGWNLKTRVLDLAGDKAVLSVVTGRYSGA